MKEVSITLWEISKEEAQQLKDLTPILVYNTFSSNFITELAGPKATYNNPHCPEHNVFYTFNKPCFKEKV